MRAHLAHTLVAALAGAFALTGCTLAPLVVEAQKCDRDAQCEPGTCFDGTCQAPVPPPDDGGPPPFTDAGPGPDWHDFALAARARVDVDNSGLTIALVGVPVVVRVDAGHPALEHAIANGMAFYDDQGNLLPHEIERAEPGGARIWVRPSVIPIGTDAGFWMYFDGAGAELAPAGVWAGHVAVWHFDDPPPLVAFADKSLALVPAEARLIPSGEVESQPGRIHNGAGLESGGHLVGGRSLDFHVQTGQVRAYSIWARNLQVGQEPFLLSKEIREGECFGVSIQLRDSGSDVRAAYRFGGCDEDDAAIIDVDNIFANQIDAYHLFTFVVDHAGGRATLNIDGVPVGEAPFDRANLQDDSDGDVVLVVGGGASDGQGNAANTFTGIVDEVRIAGRPAPDDEAVFRFRTEQRGAPVSTSVQSRP